MNAYLRAQTVALSLAHGLVMASIVGWGSASAADTPRTVVTVQAGFIPVTDVAALYLGDEVGIFKKHGVDLKVNMGTTGAALVPSVMSGEYHFSSTVAFMENGSVICEAPPSAFFDDQPHPRLRAFLSKIH
jgi:ABC-type nitrate/sulfonate/bicarbonate transport system substrate-binding protein